VTLLTVDRDRDRDRDRGIKCEFVIDFITCLFRLHIHNSYLLWQLSFWGRRMNYYYYSIIEFSNYIDK